MDLPAIVVVGLTAGRGNAADIVSNTSTAAARG
jgi:hypothetical protein